MSGSRPPRRALGVSRRPAHVASAVALKLGRSSSPLSTSCTSAMRSLTSACSRPVSIPTVPDTVPPVTPVGTTGDSSSSGSLSISSVTCAARARSVSAPVRLPGPPAPLKSSANARARISPSAISSLKGRASAAVSPPMAASNLRTVIPSRS